MDDNKNQPLTTGIQPPPQGPQEQTLVQFPKLSNQGSTQQVTSTFQNNLQQQPPVTPSAQTPPAKEQEPLQSPSSPHETSEFIAPSEKTVEIEPVVEEVGVKETVVSPKLSTADKIAGLQEAMESVPVTSKPVNKIIYPITPEEAEKATKGPLIFKNTGNAMLWLAMLIIRQFKIKEKEAKQ